MKKKKKIRSIGYFLSFFFTLFLFGGMFSYTEVGAATRVFYDGFEDGTTNKWDPSGPTDRNRCASATSAADGVVGAHAGIRMASCNWNGIVAWNDPNAYTTLSLNSWSYTNEMFIRFWIRLDQDMDNKDGAKLFRLGFGGDSDTFWQRDPVSQNGGTHEAWTVGGNGIINAWSPHNFEDRQWHKIEIYIKSDTGPNGAITVWMDGVLTRSYQYPYTGVTSTGTSRWYPFNLMSNWSNNPGWEHDDKNHVYWDDFEIYSDSSAGSPAIGSLSDATVQVSGSGDTTPPTSPTNLAANATSSSSISVSWNPATDNVGVTGYIVERCQGTGCSNFTQVGTPTASPFVDSGLTANTFYNYHVRATDAANNLSGWSNVVGATTQPASSPVTRVFFDGSESGNTNLWSQDGSRDKCVSVTSAADGVTGPYAGSRMIRCNDNGTVAWNANDSFETMKLPSFTATNEVFYRVRVRLDQNMSKTSGSAKKLLRIFGNTDTYETVRTQSGMNWGGFFNSNANQIPSYWGDAPGDYTAQTSGWHLLEYYYNRSTGVVKAWHDEVLVSSSTIPPFGSMGQNQDFYLTSNFSDPHDATNHVYFDEFEVFTDSMGGIPAVGSMSDATVTIGSGGGGDTTPPTSPTNLAATSPSASSISVSWNPATDNVGVTGYIVERCQGSGCSNFTQVGTPTASPFVDSGLTTNTFYNYHVRATDAANNLSGWSNVVGATTQSATPVTTLTIDNTDAATSQSGSWSPSTNFPGYYGTNYHYSPNATGHWFEWTASTLSPGTYEVYAYWNANPDRPTDVSYLITHSGGTATRNNINQTQNGSQWNLLGTYTFGTTGTVRVQSGGTGTEGTVADAIRFVKTNTVACNTVTTANFSQSAYNSYGAPFDAFQTSTNLMNTQCNSADTHTVNLTTGITGDTTRIVYTKGYWYDAVTTAWRQYTGTCTGALNGEWCQGSVSATITDANISTANAANPTYLVGMTCSVQGGSWKCGCRDTACSNFSWQIQGAGQ